MGLLVNTFLLHYRRNKWVADGRPPFIITFSGGLGAQIISASIYNFLQLNDIPCVADLSYFKKSPYINPGSNNGPISTFPWQLWFLGLSPSSFRQYYDRKPCYDSYRLISDGSKKLSLFLVAANHLETQTLLNLNSHEADRILGKYSFLSKHKYSCAHLRRGDYLAVASYLVPESAFVSAVKYLATTSSNLAILSDSIVNQSLQAKLYDLCSNLVILDSIPPEDAFVIMYFSQSIVCSNSQFSLAAAMLSRKPSLIPSNWYDACKYKRRLFGNIGSSKIEHLLRSGSDFMLFNNEKCSSDIQALLFS